MNEQPARRSRITRRSPAVNAAEAQQHKWAKRRRDTRFGWSLIVSGGLLGLFHWLRHMGVVGIGIDPVVQDFVIGYGTAMLLVIVGLCLLPA